MSDGTKIEWTDATWNVVNGCSVCSPGCTNCYAMRLAGTRLQHVESRKSLTIDTRAGPVWNGTTKFNEPVLLDPIRWKRPRRIFVCAHGDLFHESVPDEWIDRVFAVMALAPQHQFQVLTKRSARMRAYMGGEGLINGRGMQVAIELMGPLCDEDADPDEATRLWDRMERIMDRLPRLSDRWPLPNVWLGVSVEDQARADERIPDLLATPAAVRWLSCEPLLGPVDLTWISFPNERGGMEHYDALDLHSIEGEPIPEGDCDAVIDWVVAGGESGPGARPMHPDWARSLRDQCAAAEVAFLFKQWGAFLPAGQIATQTGLWNPSCGSSLCTTKRNAGRSLDGIEHNGYPA